MRSGCRTRSFGIITTTGYRWPSINKRFYWSPLTFLVIENEFTAVVTVTTLAILTYALVTCANLKNTQGTLRSKNDIHKEKCILCRISYANFFTVLYRVPRQEISQFLSYTGEFLLQVFSSIYKYLERFNVFKINI